MRKSHAAPIWFPICAILFLALIHGASFPANAQASETPSPSPEQKLTEAQTKYYEAQAAKVNEDRSTWQKVINLSAFIAALVAVLSLVLNYSSTLRTQRDSQFLEALKRFGDKDSPSVRASAAGLLAKLSTQSAIIFRWQKPNFDIVLDQLMAGLLLEENSVCVASIIDAVRNLSLARPLLVLQRIGAANLRVQKDMVRALAEFLATMTADEHSALGPGIHWSEAANSTPYSDHVLKSLVLRYEDDFRRGCRSAIQGYKLLLSPRAQKEMVTETQREVSSIANRLSLNVNLCTELLKPPSASRRPAGARNLKGIFLANADLSFADLKEINLISAQLQGTKLQSSSLQGVWLNGANLQGANLDRVDLQGAALIETKLQGASLVGAKLQQAVLSSAELQPLELKKIDGTIEIKKTDLQDANLEGAKLAFANLRNADAQRAIFNSTKLKHAKLHGMSVGNDPYRDVNANFEKSDWWAANFFEREGVVDGNNDDSLLEFLFNRYGSEIPKDTNKLSWSVQQFVNKKAHPEDGKA